MKRFLSILLIILIAGSAFTGCSYNEKSGEVISTAYPTEANADEIAEYEFPKEGYLKLYSNGVEQETYEYFYYSTTAYYEDGAPKGFLSGDGEGFFTPMEDKLQYLPVISGYCRIEGLDVRLIEGARITQIRAYFYKTPNGGLEMDSFNSLTEFNKVFIESTGHLIIDITVLFEGPYIKELDGRENWAMDYAFIITDSPSAFPAVCPGEQ